MPMTASSPSGGRALPSSLGGGGGGGGGGRGAAGPSSSSSSYFLSQLEQGNAIPGGGIRPGVSSSGAARASPSKPPAAAASGTASAGGGGGGGGGAYQMLGPAVSVEVKLGPLLGPLLPAPRFSLQHGFSQRLIEAYKRLPPDKRCARGVCCVCVSHGWTINGHPIVITLLQNTGSTSRRRSAGPFRCTPSTRSWPPSRPSRVRNAMGMTVV